MRLLSYEQKKAAVIISLMLYGTVGIGDKFLFNEHPEPYPVFSWFLFAYVPVRISDYTFELVALNGATYDPPLPFSSTRFLFDALGQAPTQYTPVITALGEAIRMKDAAAIADARERLERIFLGAPATYRIVRVAYDPLVLWKEGTYLSSSTIATFDAGKL